MRYVYLFLVIVLMSSCAHNRLRLRKVDKHDSIEIAQHDTHEKRSKKEDKRPEVISVTEGTTANVERAETAPEVIASTPEFQTRDSEHSLSNESNNLSPSNSEHSTSSASNPEDVDPANAYKISEAFKAERNAKTARNLMIGSFVSLIIPFFNFFSILFFLASGIFLLLSDRSDYITLKGERFARSARIMQIVYGILLILVIAAVLALIFL